MKLVIYIPIRKVHELQTRLNVNETDWASQREQKHCTNTKPVRNTNFSADTTKNKSDMLMNVESYRERIGSSCKAPECCLM